jgi:membrane protein implicated in regulation of membrane protease activity
MNQFDMIAFVVLVIMIASVVKAVVRSRKPDPTPVQDARLSQLEERVKALEAVVGDSSFELKQKLRELEK